MVAITYSGVYSMLVDGGHSQIKGLVPSGEKGLQQKNKLKNSCTIFVEMKG